jgi:RNA polymerase sigma factor (sigma-70 family)
MSFPQFDADLQRVARYLPFALDNIEEVDKLFTRWKTTSASADKHLVDIWTYCYVRRYFAKKFVRYEYLPISDFDELVEKAHQNAATQLAKADKLASWLSVICKNVFLRYFEQRKSRTYYGLETIESTFVAEEQTPINEQEIVSNAIEKAIAQLTPTLQQVARLKLLEHKEYAEIAEIMGKEIPIIRSYFNKVINALKQDESLMALSIFWLLVHLDI